MKYSPFLIVACSILFFGCPQVQNSSNVDEQGRACCSKYTYQDTVIDYYTAEELRSRSRVEFLPARALSKPGKIYKMGNMLLISESLKGVHVVDNSNPQMPVNKQFISIPGNVDIAMRNNVLFADSYTDVLAIDIDKQNLLSRTQDVIPFQQIKEHAELMGVEHLLIKAKRVETFTATVKCGACEPIINRGAIMSGKSGSMARFAVLRDYLFVLTENMLNLYVVNNSGQLDLMLETELRDYVRFAETIFIQDDFIYIGAATGMAIFELGEDTPQLYLSHVATQSHFISCDPVFVSGDHAFVTLRSQKSSREALRRKGRCGWAPSDVLQVYNVAEKYRPKMVAEQKCYNPHGLAVLDNKIYLCEGEGGFKILQINKMPSKPWEETFNGDNTKVFFPEVFSDDSFHAYDVIIEPGSGLLFLIGNDGLRQYQLKPFKLLSTLPVANNPF